MELSFKPSVSSHGYNDARIFFLTGYPLKEDLNTGLALSGHNENTIQNFLRVEKYSIKECYRASVIREKLAYSGTNARKLEAALKLIDVPRYESLLLDELNEVKPNLIVPMDDIALRAVYPHIDTMKKPKGRKHWVYCYRGSVLPLRLDWQQKINPEKPIRVIPTLSPQLIYNDWKAKAYVPVDYGRIVRFKDSQLPIQDFGIVRVIRSAALLEEFFIKYFLLWQQDNSIILTFDIETWGGFITCISFCFSCSNESISVPLMGSDIPRGEMVFIWKIIAKALQHRIAKCGQNIKFDWLNCERYAFYPENVIHDTLLKASLIYPELPRGLDFLTSIYTPIAYYKDEGKEYNPKLHTRDRLYLYNAKDSLATSIVNQEQDVELEEEGLKELYYTEVAPLILIYKNIDQTGILVDDEKRKEKVFKYKLLLDTNLRTLRTMLGNGKFNPNSSAQVGTVVYEELGYPKRVKIDEEGKKSYKTDKDTLDDLLINFGNQTKSGIFGYNTVTRIIGCRKISRILDYLDTAIHPDGRWRASSNIGGPSTGRTSSTKTIDEEILQEDQIKKKKSITRKLGRSLQTISKHGFQLDEDVYDDFDDVNIANDLRAIFVPRRGFCFIEGDGKQAEARVVAVLAEDYELLASFDEDPSIHAKTAALLFNFPVEQVGKKEPKVPKIGVAYYDIGKRARHAGNYDMQEFRLAQMTHLPLKECKRILTVFHSANPNLREVFHQQVRDALNLNRQLVNPFGRKRTFFDRVDNSFYKTGYAQIPQSTISDLTKFTPRHVISDLDGYMKDYFFLSEMHDGILAEVHLDLKEKYMEVFKKHYERRFSFAGCTLPREIELSIPCELSISTTTWQELKEVHFG